MNLEERSNRGETPLFLLMESETGDEVRRSLFVRLCSSNTKACKVSMVLSLR